MKPLLLASILLALPLQAQNNTPCDAISGVLDKVQNEYVAEGNFNKALVCLFNTVNYIYKNCEKSAQEDKEYLAAFSNSKPENYKRNPGNWRNRLYNLY